MREYLSVGDVEASFALPATIILTLHAPPLATSFQHTGPRA
jgi:hypothetical protein